MFFRFLKNMDMFDIFVSHCKLSKHYNQTFLERVQLGKLKPRDYLISTVGFREDDDIAAFFDELDNKWLLFMYDNKMYGTSDTISKNDLLDYIADIIEYYPLNEETTKRAREILELEGIHCYYV